MNLRQVSVLEKMKIENALFCIITISDLGPSGRIFEFSSFRKKKIKRAGPFAYFFRKQFIKRSFLKKLKKNSNFWCCLGILDTCITGVLPSESDRKRTFKAAFRKYIP